MPSCGICGELPCIKPATRRALEQFDFAYRLDNKLSRPNVAIASMLVDQGKYRDADPYFAEELEQHADDAQVHFAKRAAPLHEGRANEAEEFAASAAKLGLDSPLFLRHRSMIAMQQGDFPRAEKYCELALSQSPEQFTALTNLALSLAQQADAAKRDRALAVATQVAKLRPGHPQAQATLGWVLYRRGQLEKAEAALRGATAARYRTTVAFLLGSRVAGGGQRRGDA